MALNFLVLYGSVRSDRQGIRFARFLEKQLAERGHEATLVDPCDLDLPLLDKMYKEYPKGEAPQAMQTLAELIRPADGFLVVSGEYNHGIPPALKNLLDHFLEEWFWRPSAMTLWHRSCSNEGIRTGSHLSATPFPNPSTSCP
jgi:NAD(P)H-dependent FMN reductase